MAFLGKKACTRKQQLEERTTHMHARERNNWKEEQHTRMGGRPNDGRVRVLVRYCKWLKSPKCINSDT
jgi:hypothetical protein